MRPAFLDNMSWAMAEVYAATTDRILINLARHFPMVKPGEPLPGAFEYQARMLAQMGQVNSETVDIIMGSLGSADNALRAALEASIVEALKDEEPQLRKAAEKGLLMGGGFAPEVTPNQMQAFKAFYQQSADKLNLVNTVMLESTQAAYQATVSDVTTRIQRTQSILNTSAGEVVTGVSTYNQAMRDAVRKMVDNGLTGFVDHGGHRWSPEAYVAMDIRTTMYNTSRAAIWERADSYGCDTYQVSSHNGARPLCAPWQAKVISRSNTSGMVEDLHGNKVRVYAQSETSYGQAAGLFGVNCRHYPMTFIPGFSTLKGQPQSEEENAKTYEQTQEQRGLERKLRAEKRDLEVLKAQGASPEAINAQKERVRNASADIDDFCKKTGLPRRKTREYAPINAKFPNPETYDTADFPTEQRDKMREFFGGGSTGGTEKPQQVGPRRADFTPAKTIQEAEAQARKFVGSYGDVSYKGIDLEYANACNRVLADVQANFGVDPLGSVQPMNMRTKLFRDSQSEAAYRWGGGGDLYINPNFYRSKAVYAKHKAEIDSLTETVMRGGERLLANATGAKREYIQALLSTGRQCVSQSHDFVEGTFIHENGHRLDDHIFRKALREAYGVSNVMINDRLSESRHQYGGNISGYAVSNNQEYIAESFTAWWFGESDRIDPVIRSVFEGALKNGR